MAFLRKHRPHSKTSFLHSDTVHNGIWTGKINIFKNTGVFCRLLTKIKGEYTVLIDYNNFTGANIANELRTNGIEGRAFTCENPAIFKLPQTKRTNTVSVACADERIFCHHYKGK